MAQKTQPQENHLVPLVPGDSEAGVTLTPTSSSPTLRNRPNPAVGWCFTWHNYTDLDIKKACGSIGSTGSTLRYLVFSEEKGHTGVTPHLQGYLQFKRKSRPNTLGWPEQVHFEKAKGNKDQNLAYITKEGGNLYLNGKLQRKVNLLSRDNFWVWEKDLMEILEKEPDDRTINWYWEPGGTCGKSTFTKYLVAEHNALIVSHKASDMKYGVIAAHETDGVWPDIILIDIPRNVDLEYLSYTGIEEIKNGCFFSNKYESRKVVMPNPHIVIFSNEEPNLEKMTLNRWRVHRITESECTPATAPGLNGAEKQAITKV